MNSPLPLPRFTFLSGTKEHNLRLAAIIAALDPHLGLEEFSSPLEASAQLLATGNAHSFPIRGHENDWKVEFPGGTYTADEYMTDLHLLLRSKAGNGFLGRAALQNMKREGDLDIFTRHLFLDTTHSDLILPFIQEFGKDSCLYLCSKVSDVVPLFPGHILAIPFDDEDAGMSYLSHELRSRPMWGGKAVA